MLLGLYGVSRVEEFTGIYHGKDRRNYNNLAQADYSKAVKCRFEGDAPSGDPDCDNAYVYSGDTYDFFNKGFGRDSYDNQGSPLISYVHYASEICPNAFWNGQFMTYCSTFPHDDVAGHEITHGVTEFSANLVYAYQPGALNDRTYAVDLSPGGQARNGGGGTSPSRMTANCHRSFTVPTLSCGVTRSTCKTTKVRKTTPTWRTNA